MTTNNSVLKIIIVHENLIAGIAAVTVLRRLIAQLEAELEIKSGAWHIDSNVWKFEMLRDPELCVQAAAEAAEADMIIISVGSDGLPARVKDWIESVLPMKEGRPAALVALLEPQNDAGGRSSRSETYLRQQAGQFGLDFFCNTDELPGRVRSFTSDSERIPAIWRSLSPELSPAMSARHRVCFEEN